MHSDDTKDRAVLLYASGLSVRAAARRLQKDRHIAVSPMTIARWARQRGLSRPVGDRRTIELGGEARSLYESGLNVEDVARRLGTGRTTVANRLREIGVVIRPSGSRYLHALSKDRLRAAYLHRGRTIRSIAAEVDCSPATVYRLLRVHGLKKRPRRPKA